MPKLVQMFAKYLLNHIKNAQRLNILPKWQNFVKSDHTKFVRQNEWWWCTWYTYSSLCWMCETIFIVPALLSTQSLNESLAWARFIVCQRSPSIPSFGPSSSLSRTSVWPDLAKFCQFWRKLKCLWQSYERLFSI